MIDLINKKIKHKMFGIGTVVEQDERSITVRFQNRTSIFGYPAAFEKYIAAEDSDIADAIAAELKAINDAKDAAKAIAAAKIAEEQMRQKELRAQMNLSSRISRPAKARQLIKRDAGNALTYLVFQGDTYDEEKNGQFIWAPKYTKNGRTMHHWDRLMDVREGDVIFHCSNGYIKAISRVNSAYVDSARPDHTSGDWSNWEKDGRRVDCDYHVLRTPLRHGLYKEVIQKYCDVKYAPFNIDGDGNMGYLFDLNKELAIFFAKEISKSNPEMS